jgi:hypothetical protein
MSAERSSAEANVAAAAIDDDSKNPAPDRSAGRLVAADAKEIVIHRNDRRRTTSTCTSARGLRDEGGVTGGGGRPGPPAGSPRASAGQIPAYQA